MQLTSKLLAAGVLVLGVAVGGAFALGVAYGRGDPQVVETGLSAQEIQALLGTSNAAGQGGLPGGGGFAGGLQNGATGSISAIDGSTLVISSFLGEVAVTIEPDATIRTLVPGSAADLEVGDFISATGEAAADGSVLASAVSQIPESLAAVGRLGQAGGVTGELASVDDDTITVSGPQGEVTVTLAADASVSVLVDGTTADLAVGDNVNAAGEVQDDGSVIATAVSQVPESFAGAGGRPGGFGGQSGAGNANP